jgi:hypothetical protein
MAWQLYQKLFKEDAVEKPGTKNKNPDISC